MGRCCLLWVCWRLWVSCVFCGRFCSVFGAWFLFFVLLFFVGPLVPGLWLCVFVSCSFGVCVVPSGGHRRCGCLVGGLGLSVLASSLVVIFFAARFSWLSDAFAAVLAGRYRLCCWHRGGVWVVVLLRQFEVRRRCRSLAIFWRWCFAVFQFLRRRGGPAGGRSPGLWLLGCCVVCWACRCFALLCFWFFGLCGWWARRWLIAYASGGSFLGGSSVVMSVSCCCSGLLLVVFVLLCGCGRSWACLGAVRGCLFWSVRALAFWTFGGFWLVVARLWARV